jgi:hypothetical protein
MKNLTVHSKLLFRTLICVFLSLGIVAYGQGSGAGAGGGGGGGKGGGGKGGGKKGKPVSATEAQMDAYQEVVAIIRIAESKLGELGADVGKLDKTDRMSDEKREILGKQIRKVIKDAREELTPKDKNAKKPKYFPEHARQLKERMDGFIARLEFLEGKTTRPSMGTNIERNDTATASKKMGEEAEGKKLGTEALGRNLGTETDGKNLGTNAEKNEGTAYRKDAKKSADKLDQYKEELENIGKEKADGEKKK